MNISKNELLNDNLDSNIQKQPAQQKNKQKKKTFGIIENEFVSDVCHGGEIQHYQNPDFRDFLPGKCSASAT